MNDQESIKNLWDLFFLGGWAMVPLFLFSVFTIALVVERVITIFIYNNLFVRKLHRNVMMSLNNNDLEGAKEYCRSCSRKDIGAHIILSGLNMAGLGEHRMEKAIESEASEKINKLERGFSLMIAIGSLAPITGFLGTVSGMINAFQSIAKASDINAQLVANGIFEALITTAYGLAIAIIAIAAYNFFLFFVDRFTAEIEQVGSDVVTSVLLMNNEKD